MPGYVIFCMLRSGRSGPAKLAVPGAAEGRLGRIENHVGIMDGTAAVSADVRSEVKTGHWGNLRRLERAAAASRKAQVRRPAVSVLKVLPASRLL